MSLKTLIKRRYKMKKTIIEQLRENGFDGDERQMTGCFDHTAALDYFEYDTDALEYIKELGENAALSIDVNFDENGEVESVTHIYGPISTYFSNTPELDDTEGVLDWLGIER
ncbi:MAG: hypothetical protein GY870_04620 [archaeon]|nr:hypothetical protein [archaeon]